ESEFFDTIINAITRGKQLDRFINNSDHLSRLSGNLLNGNGEANNGEAPSLPERIAHFVQRTGLGSEDVKNLSIAALIAKMIAESKDDGIVQELKNLLSLSKAGGYADKKLSSLGVKLNE